MSRLCSSWMVSYDGAIFHPSGRWVNYQTVVLLHFTFSFAIRANRFIMSLADSKQHHVRSEHRMNFVHSAITTLGFCFKPLVNWRFGSWGRVCKPWCRVWPYRSTGYKAVNTSRFSMHHWCRGHTDWWFAISLGHTMSGVTIELIDLHCVATSSWHGHVDELATEPFAAPRAWNRPLTELKLLRLTDSFCHDLQTFLFDSVYGHQNTDWLCDVPSVF